MAEKTAEIKGISLSSSRSKDPIQRASCWQSSIKSIFLKYTPQQLVMRDIGVELDSEEGIDWGGLRNEWLSILSREVFHPNFGLFVLATNGVSVQPSPLAFLVPDCLTHFRFLGRLLGKSLISEWTLEVSFTKSFLKHLLGKNIYIEDMNDIDQELGKNLSWINNNDIGDGSALCYSFTD